LRELEARTRAEEDRAQQMLDNDALKDLLTKKW